MRSEARGCRATVGILEGSSREVLEAAWGFKNLFWRALGDVLEAHWAVLAALGEPWGHLGRSGGGLGGVLEGAGAVLEAYRSRPGRSPGRLGAVLGALEAMLEPSGGQKAPKMEPKRVPNRAPEAT